VFEMVLPNIRYIGDVTMNGFRNQAVRYGQVPIIHTCDRYFEKDPCFSGPILAGSKQEFDQRGPEGMSRWIFDQKEVLITDTTLNSAQVSLLSSSLRNHDISKIVSQYSKALPQLLSIDCWGGSVFQANIGILKEDPWRRISLVREQAPNILLQAQIVNGDIFDLNSCSGNTINRFFESAISMGIDIFRVLDHNNDIKSIEGVASAAVTNGGFVVGEINYYREVLNDRDALKAYIDSALRLEKLGVHLICLSDFGGLMTPKSIKFMIDVLKQEVQLPVGLKTTDTSGLGAACVLESIGSHVDTVDLAIDSFSGALSQPCMGSVVASLSSNQRQPGLESKNIQAVSSYLNFVRKKYSSFETDFKGLSSAERVLEISSTLYSRMRRRAHDFNLDDRWLPALEVRSRLIYSVNESHLLVSVDAINDLALMVVAADLVVSVAEDKESETYWDAAVKICLSALKDGSFKDVTGVDMSTFASILYDDDSTTKTSPQKDFYESKIQFVQIYGEPLNETDVFSYIFTPEEFSAYHADLKMFGNLGNIPTMTFFYGLAPDEVTTIDSEDGGQHSISNFGYGQQGGKLRFYCEVDGEVNAFDVEDNIHVK